MHINAFTFFCVPANIVYLDVRVFSSAATSATAVAVVVVVLDVDVFVVVVLCTHTYCVSFS